MLPFLPRHLAHALETTFHIRYVEYWNRLFGLDIIKLDDDVIHSGMDESMEDAILRQYGEDARKLIDEILAWEIAYLLSEKNKIPEEVWLWKRKANLVLE